MRGGRHAHPQTRTWLLVGGIFAAVSAWLFWMGRPRERERGSDDLPWLSANGTVCPPIGGRAAARRVVVSRLLPGQASKRDRDFRARVHGPHDIRHRGADTAQNVRTAAAQRGAR